MFALFKKIFPINFRLCEPNMDIKSKVTRKNNVKKSMDKIDHLKFYETSKF